MCYNVGMTKLSPELQTAIDTPNWIPPREAFIHMARAAKAAEAVQILLAHDATADQVAALLLTEGPKAMNKLIASAGYTGNPLSEDTWGVVFLTLRAIES